MLFYALIWITETKSLSIFSNVFFLNVAIYKPSLIAPKVIGNQHIKLRAVGVCNELPEEVFKTGTITTFGQVSG